MSLSLSSLGNTSNVSVLFNPLAVDCAGSDGEASRTTLSTFVGTAPDLPPLDLTAGFFSSDLESGSPPSSPFRLEDSDGIRKRHMIVVQATPVKRRFNVDATTACYLAIKNQLESGTLNYNQTSCSLRWIGAGEYSDCYRITAPDHMMGYVVKAFHQIRINRNPLGLKAMAEHSINQFRKLKALQVGVADIINVDTAMRDCFTIVEFVPIEIKPETWSGLSFAELDADQKNLLEKVKQMFEIAVTHNLSLDLLPSNLRQRETGEVVITDFCEEPFDEDAFDVEISTRLKKWSSHRSVQRFLMQNLTDSFKAIHETVISSSDFQGE